MKKGYYTHSVTKGQYTIEIILNKREMVMKYYRGEVQKGNLIKTYKLFSNKRLFNELSQKNRESLILVLAKNNIGNLYDILKVIPASYCNTKILSQFTNLYTTPVFDNSKNPEIERQGKKFLMLVDKKRKAHNIELCKEIQRNREMI